MRIILANPRGFCAGVDRAIGIVERALELYGAPVYVRHAIVHNQHVVNRLRDRGAVFIEDLAEVPDGSMLIRMFDMTPIGVRCVYALGGHVSCPSLSRLLCIILYGLEAKKAYFDNQYSWPSTQWTGVGFREIWFTNV